MLKNVVKKIKGSLLVISMDDQKMLDMMDKNKDISEVYLINTYNKKQKKEKGKKQKRVTLKKIKKKYKKTKTNNLLCNLDDSKINIREFLYFSLYVTDKYIYIYNSDYLEKLEHRYKRYSNNVLIKDNILIVDVKNIKVRKLRKIFYVVIDLITDGLDFVGDFLIR
ncbi:MAG: hypothetical protein R3Y21_01375 [Mycoplasmatota bacterium]